MCQECHLSSGLVGLGTGNIWVRSCIVAGAVLGIVGCLAASLVSTHQMPVASLPNCDNQKQRHTLPNVSWRGTWGRGTKWDLKTTALTESVREHMSVWSTPCFACYNLQETDSWIKIQNKIHAKGELFDPRLRKGTHELWLYFEYIWHFDAKTQNNHVLRTRR